MLKLRVSVYLFMGLVLVGLANAATIHGTVYDLSLKKVNDARIEINTSPKQFLIAQNASYSFNVPNGFYTIKAQLMQKNTVIASVQENITIKQDGSYVLDLILFPDVEEGIEDIDIDVNGNIIETRSNRITVGSAILLAIGIILMGLSYFKKYRKQEKETAHEEKVKIEQKEEKDEDNDVGQLIEIIREEGGRITQKEIRKQIPLSEAKISLMIAELEHKGIIEKIKKGRGNIIILKKK
ncbi:hypothetical protein HYX04_02895 [Candidatus Woesearchaeota archaeon]|nr:hypothetical protein [Candidatus Woesearchaeota archaeon]